MILEEEILDLMVANKWTLATAESCTGGALSARLTRIAGASQYFLGGIISYSNQYKSDLLGVPQSTLERYGAVSRETVEAMVNGLETATHAIAISGIAGPTGGTPEKPVGTIFCAVKIFEKVLTTSWHLKGAREEIIAQAVEKALTLLLHSSR